jgi:hypothetical protein
MAKILKIKHITDNVVDVLSKEAAKVDVAVGRYGQDKHFYFINVDGIDDYVTNGLVKDAIKITNKFEPLTSRAAEDLLKSGQYRK